MPRGVRLHQGCSCALINTLTGTYAPLGSVQMNGVRLTAFAKNRIIDNQEFLVFDADCNYGVILGGSFLQQIGTNLNYSDLELEWLGNTTPMESLTV